LNNVYTSLKKIGTQRQISLPAQAATFVLTAGGVRRLPASTENPGNVNAIWGQTCELATVSSVSPLSEQIKEIWVACGVYTEIWSYAIGWCLVT